MMRTPRWRSGLAVLTVMTTALLTACSTTDHGNGPSPTAPTPPEYPGGPGSVAPNPQPMPNSHQAPPDVQAVVSQYVQARENAVSYTNPTPSTWIDNVRPLMTPEGAAELNELYAGGSGGYPFDAAKAKRLSVTAHTSCENNPDAGPPSPTRMMVTCRVVDQVVDAAGKPVRSDQVPNPWPFIGEQEPAMLMMTKTGNDWKIASDLTGQGG